MSTVLHISLLQREVMSVGRKHSEIFIWALRRKGVIGWGLVVEDFRKGRRLFSWPPVLTTWGKLRLSGGCEKERVGLGHTH